jgi:bacterioferritin
VNVVKPSQVSRELVRIADDIDAGDRPSLLLVTDRIRRVLAAVGPVGEFAAPIGQVLAQLQELLTLKYTKDVTYRSYVDRVRGPWRDSLYEHWTEHAEEERGHAYDIAMKIVAIGGDPGLASVQVPLSPPHLVGFYMALSDLELRALEAGHALLQMAGKNDPLRLMVEQIMYVDAQHMDDLRRMFESVDLD